MARRPPDSEAADRVRRARPRPAWRVAGYAAEQLIGRGASGEVWRGRASRTGDAVALKRIDASESGPRDRARAEAALLSGLDHPNLIRIHEVVPDGDFLVLVLDLAGGGSLADLLNRRTRLTPGEVVAALPPVGSALAYAHGEGVTHSDVSAANILFGTDGRPLLADLGTARLLGDTGGAHATLAYLDPSVAAGAAPSPASDVFALAGVALQALTGAPPWPVGELPGPALVALASTGLIPRLEERLADVPPLVAAVLRRALNADPSARGSAAAFALDLRHAHAPAVVELSAGRHSVLPVDPDVVPGSLAGWAQPSVAGTNWEWSADGDDLDYPGLPTGSTASPEVSAGPVPASPRFVPLPDDELPVDRSGSALTQAVRARARPSVGPPGRWERLSLWRRPSARGLIATAVILAVLVVAGGVGWWASSSHRTWSGQGAATQTAATHAPVVVSASAPNVAAASASGSRTSRSSTSAPSASAADQWAAVLRAVDDRREQAFALGDAAELRTVYASAGLLQQDIAALTKTVPDDCRVVGLRTAYSNVAVLTQSEAGVTVRATASLASATVTCATTVTGHTEPRGPVAMRIGLVRSGQSYLIASVVMG